MADHPNDSDAPFRTRGIKVPPADRPVKHRAAVRVLVLVGDQCLLLADGDPGTDRSRWYVLPGGGIDAHETSGAAAVREVFEETGQNVVESDLLGPVAQRIVVHGFSDQVIVQSEDLYVWPAPGVFDLDASGHTLEERQTFQGYGWFSIDEPPTDAPIWLTSANTGPALRRLAELAGHPDLWPEDFGEVEESTVPSSLGHQGQA